MNTLPTILVVDDEVRCLETLQRILEDDFDIKIASNIDEAKRSCSRSGCRLSCAINACRILVASSFSSRYVNNGQR